MEASSGYPPSTDDQQQQHQRPRSQAAAATRSSRAEAAGPYPSEDHLRAKRATPSSGRMEAGSAAAAAAVRGSPNALNESQSSRRRNHTKSIGHYILGKTIGEGTFGKVKLGTHILTGEKVAVKVLEKEKIIDVADVERVAREVYILKLIRHQHVVQLYEIIETSRQLYLIMEYASGGELFDYIVASGRIQEPEACRFFRQIVDGVEEIHKMNVVHRDLKPENLLLDENRYIKIVDFGLSNTYRDGQLLKTACGSPCYAAPEMIAGKEYVPSLCDIWSCGVILFAMLCGYLPFEDQNTAALYRKILAAEYSLPDFLTQNARDIITGMLTTDPTRRMTSAALRQQVWFNAVPEDPGSHRLQPQFPFEEDILEELEKFGFPPDYTQRCLRMNKHNHVTTTYHLLERKKQRMMDQVLLDQMPSLMPQDCSFLDQSSSPNGASVRIGGYDGRDFSSPGDVSGQGEEYTSNSARGHGNYSTLTDGSSGSARGAGAQARGSFSSRPGGSSPTRTSATGSVPVSAWQPQGMQVRDMRDPRAQGNSGVPAPENVGGPPSPRSSARGAGNQPVQPKWATRAQMSPQLGSVASPTAATSTLRSESPVAQGGSPAAPSRRPRSEITTPRGPRKPSADRLPGKATPNDFLGSSPGPGTAERERERSDRGGERDRSSLEERTGPGTPSAGAGWSAPMAGESGPRSTRTSFGASGSAANSGVTTSASTGSRTTATGMGSPGTSAGGSSHARSGRLPSPPRYSSKNAPAPGQPSSARPVTSPSHSTTAPSSARGSYPPSSSRGGSHSLSTRAAYSMSARSQTPDNASRHQTPSRGSASARGTSKPVEAPKQQPQSQPQSQNGSQPPQSLVQQQVQSQQQQQQPQQPQLSVNAPAQQQPAASPNSSQPSTPVPSTQPPGTPPQVQQPVPQIPLQSPTPLSAQQALTGSAGSQPSSTAAALAALRARRPYTPAEGITPRSEANTPRGQTTSSSSGAAVASGSNSGRGPTPHLAQPQTSPQGVPRWPERPVGASIVGEPGRGATPAERHPSVTERPTQPDRPLSSRVAPTTDLDASLPATFAPLSARDAAAAPLSSREVPCAKAREDRRAALDTLRTSSRPPRLIMQELQRVLAAQRVASKQVSPLTLRCQWLGLKFDVEVAPLDRLGSIHAVRARRTAGEPWQYKDVCNRLLAELRIA